MGNINKNKIIKIFGVTLPKPQYRTRGYGHGCEGIFINKKLTHIEYVDYLIDDLIVLIKQQKKEKEFIKGLSK